MTDKPLVISLTSDYLDLTYGGAIYHSTKWRKPEDSRENEVNIFRDKIKKQCEDIG